MKFMNYRSCDVSYIHYILEHDKIILKITKQTTKGTYVWQ